MPASLGIVLAYTGLYVYSYPAKSDTNPLFFSTYMLLLNTLPALLTLIDFLMSALLFKANHSPFLIAYLLSYYIFNFTLCRFFDYQIYTIVALDWRDWLSFIYVGIHFVGTLLGFYLLYILS